MGQSRIDEAVYVTSTLLPAFLVLVITTKFNYMEELLYSFIHCFLLLAQDSTNLGPSAPFPLVVPLQTSMSQIMILAVLRKGILHPDP